MRSTWNSLCIIAKFAMYNSMFLSHWFSYLQPNPNPISFVVVVSYHVFIISSVSALITLCSVLGSILCSFWWMSCTFYTIYCRRSKKVKKIHYKPGQALRVPGGWRSPISRQLAHKGDKVVSPMHWLPLPPGNISGTLFVRGWVNPRAIVQLEGLCQWKIPIKPWGIEPVTSRLVAQCLNQLRYRVPPQLTL